jgi:biotin--protein ligase
MRTSDVKSIAFLFCLWTSLFGSIPAFAPPGKTIYVYADKGAGPESVRQTVSTFKAWLPFYTVETLDAEALIKGEWTQNAALFVMPGGADLPYVEKLNGAGNARIKAYVQSGGAYLGICAGAYYGSAYVQFDEGGPLEVLGDRELAFFGDKAVGPVLAPYDYRSRSGSRAATLKTNLPGLKEATVFYNGGGYFANAAQHDNVEILATYATNDLAAIVFVPIGKGKVLLSGAHFEYDPDTLLNPQDPYLQKILVSLRAGNASRKTLFYKLMNRLGLKTPVD